VRVGQRAIHIGDDVHTHTEFRHQICRFGRASRADNVGVNRATHFVDELHPRPCYRNRMIRNTLKTLVVALVAAFALSSIAEAATPTKTRHRTKHSSRVSSGAASATATKPAAKKKPAPPRPKASASTTTTTKKAPAKRRPSTKPR
jgi:hypothetical protein